MVEKIKSMKAILILLLWILSIKSYSQTFSIVKNRYTDANNTGWALSIKVEYDTGVSKFCRASCYFGELPNMIDSVKLSLIASLLSKIDDTSVCAKPVEALSYRYRGRYNRNPQSVRYNLQIEALILINYIAFSSEAVVYSPYPVLYDKKLEKEITAAGNDLAAIIKQYQKWFRKIKKNGLKNYQLPLVNKRYEWYGSLFLNQHVFKKAPKWEKLYDCPILVKEE